MRKCENKTHNMKNYTEFLGSKDKKTYFLKNDNLFMRNCFMCFLLKQRKSYTPVDTKHTINIKHPHQKTRLTLLQGRSYLSNRLHQNSILFPQKQRHPFYGFAQFFILNGLFLKMGFLNANKNIFQLGAILEDFISHWGEILMDFHRFASMTSPSSLILVKSDQYVCISSWTDPGKMHGTTLFSERLASGVRVSDLGSPGELDEINVHFFWRRVSGSMQSSDMGIQFWQFQDNNYRTIF